MSFFSRGKKNKQKETVGGKDGKYRTTAEGSHQAQGSTEDVHHRKHVADPEINKEVKKQHKEEKKGFFGSIRKKKDKQAKKDQPKEKCAEFPEPPLIEKPVQGRPQERKPSTQQHDTGAELGSQSRMYESKVDGKDGKSVMSFVTSATPMILLMCNHSKFLDGMENALKRLELNIEIFPVHISMNVTYDFTGVKLLFLVAQSSQNDIKLSRKDLTPHSVIYFQAASEQVSVFLALAGHSKSQGKTEKEGYAPSLKASFRSQNDLDRIRKQRRFISLAFTHQPNKIQFDETQIKMIKSWVEYHQSKQHTSGSSLEGNARSGDSLSGQGVSYDQTTSHGGGSKDYRTRTHRGETAFQSKPSPQEKIFDSASDQKPTYAEDQFTKYRSTDEPMDTATSVPEQTQNTERPVTELPWYPAERSAKLVIACQSSKFLERVVSLVKWTIEQNQAVLKQHINIIAHLITTAEHPSHALQDADLLLLLGMSSQRLMLISDKEPGPLDVIHREIVQENISTFFALVGHTRSQHLKSFEPYDHSELHSLFTSQPAIKQFKDNNRFISVGYATNPQNLSFNDRQTELILLWIIEKVNRLPGFRSNMNLKVNLDNYGHMQARLPETSAAQKVLSQDMRKREGILHTHLGHTGNTIHDEHYQQQYDGQPTSILTYPQLPTGYGAYSVDSSAREARKEVPTCQQQHQETRDRSAYDRYKDRTDFPKSTEHDQIPHKSSRTAHKLSRQRDTSRAQGPKGYPQTDSQGQRRNVASTIPPQVTSSSMHDRYLYPNSSAN